LWDTLHVEEVSNMIQWWFEAKTATWNWAKVVLHTVRKRHNHLEQAALPDGLLLAGDAAFPDLEVKHALGVLLRTSVEAEGMILPPLLPKVRG
jgi:hypothetical protein